MNVDALRKVYEAPGPFVSLYLDSESAQEDAAAQWGIRWRDTLRRLADDGVPEETVQALESVRGAHGDADVRVLVAAGDRVLLQAALQSRATRDTVRVDQLPHLLPLLADASLQLPHILVLIDGTGADITGFADLDTEAAEDVVRSDDLVTSKVQPGGWSQRRFQMRAEDSWNENAHRVAEAVAAMAREVGARLVVVAGEPKQVALLQKSLPEHLTDAVEQIDGGRQADGGEDDVDARRQQVATRRRLVEIEDEVTRWHDRHGEGRLTTEGLQQTVEALRKSQVDVLLLSASYDDDVRLWFGPDLTQLGTSAEELSALGTEPTGDAPAVDVLVRAAVGTGATVLVLPDGRPAPGDGVAAILRFDLN